jgi:hypothetical protein
MTSAKAKQVKYVTMIAVIINLVLPYAVSPFATSAEIKPPAGAHALPFKSQLMHMMVHHNQVPLTSSLIIAVIVATSIYLSDIVF